MRRRWLLVLALAACRHAPRVEPAGAPASAIELVDVPPAADGRDGVHGMIVFGRDVFYVSHVPMFHQPHDVQLVARVRITGGPAHLETLHTLAPERFRLDDVLAGARREFRAELYRGNFEDGGERLATVDVTIEQLVIARPLDGGAGDEYYVIGEGTAWWAIHRIGAPPSVDAIAAVDFAAAPVAGRHRGELRAGGVLGAPLAAVHPLSCLVGPDFTAPCR